MIARTDHPTDRSADLPDDPRLMEAVQEYQRRLEAGQRPPRQEFLSRYPDLAGPLTQCLDGLDLVHKVAQPARVPASPSSEDALKAEPLGDFQIVRELGRGGMGVVYEAVQLSLGRRVALKVLPFATALDAKHLQRFKTEAHAAAQLHHTNIVPIYAVGCERGVHFYAMQLIDGRTLDRAISELRGEAGAAPGAGPLGAGLRPRPTDDRGSPSPGITTDPGTSPTLTNAAAARTARSSGRNRESFRTAAGIIAQVADALEYAHEAGVVHRDIKPANLLLDTKGAVWVADFGLAQVAADVALTQTGDLLGTLRYMSPEQASGQRVLVDHRTDVYSLGATLYEWLTLAPLFPGQDRQTLLQQILNDEPRSPRQIDRAVPVELETIVLKALAKTPAERYTSAGEMAADLRRFLNEQPILARRPSLFDRGRKWMRRHPSFVGAAVVVMVLGLVGLALANALTQAAYDRERLRAKEAEERFQLARRVADDIIRMAKEELADNPMLENLHRRLLEAALAYYQELIEQRGENPDAQAELAVTRDYVKQILADLAVLQGDRQMFLLREPAVLRDLQVPLEQRPQVADLLRTLDSAREESFREFHRLGADERRRRATEVARANEAAISSVLGPQKMARLRQIALQAQGPLALRDPDIAKELKLTADQKERIRLIEADTFLGPGDRFKPGPPPKGMKEHNNRAAMERILTVFTEEQAQRWRVLTGDPFTGPLPPMFFPGRGPGKGPPPDKLGGKGGPGF